MKLTGQRSIPRDQPTVWNALNDPEVLKRSIPGCEKLERSGPDEFDMEMIAAVGPVRAKFKAKLTMSEVVAPQSYLLTFSGNGGAAGFGNGTARVQLEPEGEGTLMQYEANAQVGGKIAQVGARLVQGVSEKMAEQFFTRFVAEVEAGSPASVAAGSDGLQPGPQVATGAGDGTVDPLGSSTAWYQRPWIWVGILAASALAGWLLARG